MNFFIHTTKASDSAKLKKLQDDYKLAGLGFYWKVVELLMLCSFKVHFNAILSLRKPPISFNVVKAILNDYDLFVVDENNYVTLKIDKDNGIGEKSLESYFSFLDSSSRASGVSSGASSGASSSASSGASSGASSHASSHASSGACSSVNKKEFINNNIIADEGTEGTQNDFSRLTQALCKNRPDIAEEVMIESFFKKN